MDNAVVLSKPSIQEILKPIITRLLEGNISPTEVVELYLDEIWPAIYADEAVCRTLAKEGLVEMVGREYRHGRQRAQYDGDRKNRFMFRSGKTGMSRLMGTRSLFTSEYRIQGQWKRFGTFTINDLSHWIVYVHDQQNGWKRYEHLGHTAIEMMKKRNATVVNDLPLGDKNQLVQLWKKPPTHS